MRMIKPTVCALFVKCMPYCFTKWKFPVIFYNIREDPFVSGN